MASFFKLRSDIVGFDIESSVLGLYDSGREFGAKLAEFLAKSRCAIPEIMERPAARGPDVLLRAARRCFCIICRIFSAPAELLSDDEERESSKTVEFEAFAAGVLPQLISPSLYSAGRTNGLLRSRRPVAAGIRRDLLRA